LSAGRADTFHELRKKRNGSPSGIRLQLISNQPADPDVVQLLRDVASGRTVSGDAKDAGNRLLRSSGLEGDTFREFAASLDLSQTGSRFVIRENILRTISTWTEGDARALTDSLLRFMRQKMMPESKGEWIRRETILAELGFSDLRALFPCPPELASVRHIIKRKTSCEIVAEMTAGRKHLCVHGHAGSGKTTTLREIASQLPTGSLMVVFDCYGAGRYLDSDAYRHRPKDAFLQLSNDLASKLRVPLLLTRSDDVDYPHAFHDRLEKSAQAVSGLGQAALLIIAIDAADNSVTAGWSNKPDERHSERTWRPFESEGRRLWISVGELRNHLRKTKMDLIVSIKLMRQEGDGGYTEGGKEKRRSRKGKIFLLRANGDIEDSSGRIGAWQTHSSGTAAS